MKKLVSILFVSFALITLSACSGDDGDGEGGNGGGNNSEPAVGTWKMYGDLVDGEVQVEDIEECDQTIYKFQANGKLSLTEKYCGEGSETFNINWRKSEGNYYEILAQGQVIEAYYITFSEDKKFAYVCETPTEYEEGYAEIWKRS